jgi:hypothetical protein
MYGAVKAGPVAGSRKRGMHPAVMFLWAVGGCLVLVYWLDLFAPSAPVTGPGIPSEYQGVLLWGPAGGQHQLGYVEQGPSCAIATHCG